MTQADRGKRSHDATVFPPAQIDQYPPQIVETNDAAEVRREATTGSVIAFLPRLVDPQNDAVGTGNNAPFGTGNTILATIDLFELSSLKQTLVWRPVKFVRNRDYPKVTAEGCGFKRDSGGFALRRKQPFKYLGYYRRDVITKLEKEYAAKKPRKRKDQS
jgi:hypothetical protein